MDTDLHSQSFHIIIQHHCYFLACTCIKPRTVNSRRWHRQIDVDCFCRTISHIYIYHLLIHPLFRQSIYQTGENTCFIIKTDVNATSFIIVTSSFRSIIIRCRDNLFKVFVFTCCCSPYAPYGQENICYFIFHIYQNLKHFNCFHALPSIAQSQRTFFPSHINI